MNSKLELTLDEEVVICPNCKSMAKKNFLAEWLKGKQSCPVCFEKLNMDDFSLVERKSTI